MRSGLNKRFNFYQENRRKGETSGKLRVYTREKINNES